MTTTGNTCTVWCQHLLAWLVYLSVIIRTADQCCHPLWALRQVHSIPFSQPTSDFSHNRHLLCVLLQAQDRQLPTLCSSLRSCKHPLSLTASTEVWGDSLTLESTLNEQQTGAGEYMLLMAIILRVDNSGRFWYSSQGGWRNLAPFAYNLDNDLLYWFFLLSCLPETTSPINCLHWILVSGSALGKQGLLLDASTLFSGENGVHIPNLCFFCEFTKWAPPERGLWRLLSSCSFHIQAL